MRINWCEHAVSCTIYVKDHEWIDVGKWVYENWEYIVGMTFLPYDNSRYEQAPFEEITREEYEELVEATPKIQYELLQKYEQEDLTTGAQELACSGGQCELN